MIIVPFRIVWLVSPITAKVEEEEEEEEEKEEELHSQRSRSSDPNS